MNAITRIFWIGLLALPAVSWAAPFGYSVNSDQSPGDQLHRINLETGASEVIGNVAFGADPRRDVEGMAFDKDGELWAMDEFGFTLFRIQPVNGQVINGTEKSIGDMGSRSGNDFGMTFTCDNELLVSSSIGQTLFRVDPSTGAASAVGNLGVRISALAAKGKPTQLFGVGVGQIVDPPQPGNPNLYRIDPDTGSASLIGPLGPAVGSFFEAGLSFDEEGQLWAITDRRTIDDDTASQIFLIDLETGRATLQSTTNYLGFAPSPPAAFESLAVASPGGCEESVEPEPKPPVDGELPHGETESIPTLGDTGRTLAVLLLFLSGWIGLRGRSWG